MENETGNHIRNEIQCDRLALNGRVDRKFNEWTSDKATVVGCRFIYLFFFRLCLCVCVRSFIIEHMSVSNVNYSNRRLCILFLYYMLQYAFYALFVVRVTVEALSHSQVEAFLFLLYSKIIYRCEIGNSTHTHIEMETSLCCCSKQKLDYMR